MFLAQRRPGHRDMRVHRDVPSRGKCHDGRVVSVDRGAAHLLSHRPRRDDDELTLRGRIHWRPPPTIGRSRGPSAEARRLGLWTRWDAGRCEPSSIPSRPSDKVGWRSISSVPRYGISELMLGEPRPEDIGAVLGSLPIRSTLEGCDPGVHRIWGFAEATLSRTARYRIAAPTAPPRTAATLVVAAAVER